MRPSLFVHSLDPESRTEQNGYVRKVYPILACYVADYPEQCLITCAKYGTCTKCLVSENELGERMPGKRHTQKTTLGVIQDSSRNATS